MPALYRGSAVPKGYGVGVIIYFTCEDGTSFSKHVGL